MPEYRVRFRNGNVIIINARDAEQARAIAVRQYVRPHGSPSHLSDEEKQLARRLNSETEVMRNR